MVLSIKTAVSKNAKILALFAIVCTAIVGLVHSLTKDQIVFQQQQDLLRNLNSIIAEDSYNNVIYHLFSFFLSTSNEREEKGKKRKDNTKRRPFVIYKFLELFWF